MAHNQLSDYHNMAIATTIIRQFGAYKFIAMAGVHDVVHLNSDSYPFGGVQFGFKGCARANKVVVKVDADDTYTVKFWQITARTCKIVKKFDGIYCDMLQDIFTEVTGLETSLGTMGR